MKEVLDVWICDQNQVAILGDMNWHYGFNANPMKHYLQAKEFKQLCEDSTHDAGKIIDHCYINSSLTNLVQFSKTSCYYTDHDMMQIKIDLE